MDKVYIVMFDNGQNYGHVVTRIIDVYASLDSAEQRVGQLIKEDEEDFDGWVPYYVVERDVIK